MPPAAGVGSVEICLILLGGDVKCVLCLLLPAAGVGSAWTCPIPWGGLKIVPQELLRAANSSATTSHKGIRRLPATSKSWRFPEARKSFPEPPKVSQNLPGAFHYIIVPEDLHTHRTSQDCSFTPVLLC